MSDLISPKSITTRVLILPGYADSAEDHWQSIWQNALPNARRVQQQSWEHPERTSWVATLDGVIRQETGPLVLVAHSLGCALTNWWAQEHGKEPHAAKVKGALLVAPPDPENKTVPEFAQGWTIKNFTPMPTGKLPFKTTIVASSDDPFCTLPRAQHFAQLWGAQKFVDIGAKGHIHAPTGFGNWPEGYALLDELTK
jgi:predicted alpha/beta hydrolase family esterase